MIRTVIPKGRLNEFLEDIIKKYWLTAPVREGGNLVFKEARDISEIALEDELPYKSPKEVFFPQSERIMTFGKDGELQLPETPPPTVLFGVRPCDLEAIKVMTAVFTKGQYRDPYYKQRLDNTIIIGMECISEKKGCFCSERGIDRHSSSDCDLFFNEDGENFLVTVYTQKGKNLLDAFGVQQLDTCVQERNAGDCVSYIAPLPGGTAINSTHELLEIDADENVLFSDIDWDRITEKCIGCGTCTYICPTCHCFEFKDAEVDGYASRYRCWDSCMYPKFTLHASGHNPRPGKKERYRQRVLHKYVYIRKNFGLTACTGCGRCIRSCPAGMNIRTVVSGIMEELKHE